MKKPNSYLRLEFTRKAYMWNKLRIFSENSDKLSEILQFIKSTQ